MNKKFMLLIAVLAILVVVPACGKKVMKTEAVSGKVTLDGAPLAQCYVYFVPDGEGDSGVAITNDAGEYKLQTLKGAADAGTTPGNYKVYFTHDVVVSPAETNADGETVKDEVTKNDLPAKYLKPETSGFTAQVVKGKNTFDFDLSSK
ncbi:MAG: hypothetical protein IJL92_10365 [Thermoguttaceae bacterium]|nr:hypothetical protein [Thermoguttaceae bacterium]